jgi:hypothetical protein
MYRGEAQRPAGTLRLIRWRPPFAPASLPAVHFWTAACGGGAGAGFTTP